MTVVVTHTTPADGTFSAAGAAAWDADHALSGLGTMAEQNKTSVDIEGGTIDNTTIGATTPSTGVFTTLTAQNETLKGTGNNFFNYSQDYTQSAWSKVGSTITAASTTAPDGTSTGQTLNEDTSTGQHNINRGGSSETLVIGATYTMSVYAKQSGRSIIFIQSLITFAKSYFDIASGTVLSSGSGMTSTITSVGNGWYRCAVTFVCDSTNNSIRVIAATTGNGVQTYTGTGIASVFLWGAQLELGSTANTYIPTTTTAVYGTPTLSFSGVASIGLQSDGSLYETSAGTGNVRFYTNNIGQEQARVSHTASAVNYHQLTGSATGSGPIHSVAGSDTNIDSNHNTKGTGSHVFNTGNGIGFKVFDHGSASTGYWGAYGGGSSTQPRFTATSSSNAWVQTGTGSALIFATNAGSGYGTIQALVAHTASAVNYVQVTGSATGNNPVLSSQGSDTNIGMRFYSKGAVGLSFWTSGGSSRQFQVEHTGGSVVNYAFATGSVAGAGPIFSVAGSDTNIDLNLTPKGTGNVRFGTYTASMALTIQGYIEVKDSGGTVRKLAVIA